MYSLCYSFRDSVIFIPVDKTSWIVLKFNTNPIVFYLPFSFSLSRPTFELPMPRTCHFIRIYFLRANYHYIHCLNRSNPCNRMHFLNAMHIAQWYTPYALQCSRITFIRLATLIAVQFSSIQFSNGKDAMNHVCLTFLYRTSILLRVFSHCMLYSVRMKF